MPPPKEMPHWVWKIVSENPKPIGDGLPVSKLDEKDGFIHLSTAEQVPKTVNRFFGHTSVVHLLKVPYAKVESKIKWEEAGPGCFPHIYDNDLAKSLNDQVVEKVVTCERREGKGWIEVVEKAIAEHS